MKNSKGIIFNFLRSQRHITLSASSLDGGPEGITVNYVVDGDAIYVYINAEDYRKYTKELDDIELAGVISADQKTIQIVAHCKRLRNGHEVSAKKIIEKSDLRAQYYFTASTRFFEISPTIIRYQDYGKRPVENVFYEISLEKA